MRKVLVVSPHFPPSDTADMHRVRTTVGHYRENGWDPVVLCVRPRDTGRTLDPTLVRTVPDDIRAIEVSALPERLTAPLGLSAVGLRAWGSLNAAGRKLQAEEGCDLVFISTTAFPAMSLGPAWKRRFGTPFVLDFQDPWATFPPGAAPFRRRGVKHGLMRALHRRLERRTVPAADGLMAVSRSYIDLLGDAYPAVRDRPALVSPFGYSAEDFLLAAELGRAPWPTSGETTTCYFAGRIAPAMEGSVAALLRAIRLGRERRPEVFGRLRVRFVGTGYATHGNPSVAGRLAAQAGVEDLVEEHPDRVRLVDALKGMLEADALLVFGSEDAGYVPSKLNQCLSLPKPVICAAPRNSPLTAAVEGLDGVFTLLTDVDEGTADATAGLERLLTSGADYVKRAESSRRFEARACAARECAFFDRVLAARRGDPVRASV